MLPSVTLPGCKLKHVKLYTPKPALGRITCGLTQAESVNVPHNTNKKQVIMGHFKVPKPSLCDSIGIKLICPAPL